ncbi:MAG: PTS transporter subunit EIIC [Traorella sp.]
MNVKKTADEIVKALGGADNIVHLTYCMTRLRFSLNDEALVDTNQVEKIDGVLGCIKSGTLQVIIGKDVVDVYNEISQNYLFKRVDEKKKNMISKALDVVSATLSPLVPAIMGAGFISIVLALCAQFGILKTDSSTYLLLNQIANCVYYFFPVLISLSLASRLKVNQVFAVIVACFLLYPDFVEMLNGENVITFFGIPVALATYSKQIIPIFFSVLIQKYIEMAVNKVIPKVIRTMIGSGLVLVLTILVTITVLGPAGAFLTSLLNKGVYFIVENCGWFAVPIMAFLNPFFLASGLGSANFPIMLMSYISNGYEALILPAALAGNAVQAGFGFAIAYKSKDKEFKSVAFESAITALMGITEPIIFSVHYRLKKTFPFVMIASGIAAILPGLMHVACYALSTGILSLPAYLPGGNMNMLWACVTFVLSVVIGFGFAYFIKLDEE